MGFEEQIEFTKRPIAVTDCEMTGLDIFKHEIIEVGLVLADQETFEIIDTLDLKIIPQHIETADPKALAVTGYRPEDWTDAVPLKEAMERYSAKAKNAVFAAYNVAFDWAFMDKGFKNSGVPNLMDYHMIDIPSIAWATFRHTGIKKIRLRALCEIFGIPPEPDVHRAINGAMVAYQVLKKLLETKKS